MYKEKLKESGNLISINPADGSKIKEIEIYIGKQIPPSFLKYMQEIGAGGNSQFDILGTGNHPSGKAAFILANERIKNDLKDLPQSHFLSWILEMMSPGI